MNQKEIIYVGPIGCVAISFEMVAMQILYVQTNVESYSAILETFSSAQIQLF